MSSCFTAVDLYCPVVFKILEAVCCSFGLKPDVPIPSFPVVECRNSAQNEAGATSCRIISGIIAYLLDVAQTLQATQRQEINLA